MKKIVATDERRVEEHDLGPGAHDHALWRRRVRRGGGRCGFRCGGRRSLLWDLAWLTRSRSCRVSGGTLRLGVAEHCGKPAVALPERVREGRSAEGPAMRTGVIAPASGCDQQPAGRFSGFHGGGAPGIERRQVGHEHVPFCTSSSSRWLFVDRGWLHGVAAARRASAGRRPGHRRRCGRGRRAGAARIRSPTTAVALGIDRARATRCPWGRPTATSGSACRATRTWRPDQSEVRSRSHRASRARCSYGRYAQPCWPSLTLSVLVDR